MSVIVMAVALVVVVAFVYFYTENTMFSEILCVLLMVYGPHTKYTFYQLENNVRCVANVCISRYAKYYTISWFSKQRPKMLIPQHYNTAAAAVAVAVARISCYKITGIVKLSTTTQCVYRNTVTVCCH